MVCNLSLLILSQLFKLTFLRYNFSDHSFENTYLVPTVFQVLKNCDSFNKYLKSIDHTICTLLYRWRNQSSKKEVVCSTKGMRTRTRIKVLLPFPSTSLHTLTHTHSWGRWARNEERKRKRKKGGRYAFQVLRFLFRQYLAIRGNTALIYQSSNLCPTWIICLEFFKHTMSFHTPMPTLHADLSAYNIHPTTDNLTFHLQNLAQILSKGNLPLILPLSLRICLSIPL